jgi:hypothetical protein
MAGRRSPVTDICELLRRLQLGDPDRRIARDLGSRRNTAARCRQWAQDQGLLRAPTLPELAVLAALLQPTSTERPANEQSLVEPFRERVKALHDRGVEGRRSGNCSSTSTPSRAATPRSSASCGIWPPPERGATLRLEVDPGADPVPFPPAKIERATIRECMLECCSCTPLALPLSLVGSPPLLVVAPPEFAARRGVVSR